MGHSLGLAAYLAFTARADNYARRKLELRKSEGKEDSERVAERFGQANHSRPDGLLVWFHAASVGESLSILELVRRLGDLREDLSFLITTGTVTSSNMLSHRLPERTIHQYIPVDTNTAVNSFLDHWKPDLAIWTESELWPTLMVRTHKRKIPMLLINARISSATHRSWRWMPGFAKSLLRRFEFVLAQDDKTAWYFRRLGLPARKVEVTGTLKEGSAALPYDEDERNRMASQIATRPVWLAASTHEGEEAIAAEAHKSAARSTQRLLLIVAPRHPERGNKITKALQKDGWLVKQRSNGEIPDAETQIYVADTLGEMGLWFRLAPVCFLGGSMAKIGGHNPFEPAALGSAIIHGPHIFKVVDIYDKLAKAGATKEVKSPSELAAAVGQLLSPDKAAIMAHAAWEVTSRGAEVTDRALDLLQGYLPESSERAAS